MIELLCNLITLYFFCGFSITMCYAPFLLVSNPARVKAYLKSKGYGDDQVTRIIEKLLYNYQDKPYLFVLLSSLYSPALVLRILVKKYI